MLKLFQTCSSSHKTLLPPKYFYQNSPKIACEPPILPKICPRLSIWLNSVEKCIFTKWSYQKPVYFAVVSAQKAKFWRNFVKFRRFFRFLNVSRETFLCFSLLNTWIYLFLMRVWVIFALFFVRKPIYHLKGVKTQFFAVKKLKNV